ncbi:ABC transporter substrate-binding protein, partial [Streptomyces olivaceoviridis]
MTVRRIRTAAAAALLIGVAACSAPGDGTGSGDVADSVVIGVASEPDTLSPLLGYGKDGASKIFDGLLTRDADLKLKPALARALPAVGDNGLTYTFALRDGVKFSDGKPLTSADVVFTYETILDAETNNPHRSELDAIKKVRADGEDRVVFTLKYPYAAFAGRTVLPIVPEHIAGAQNPNTGAFNT